MSAPQPQVAVGYMDVLQLVLIILEGVRTCTPHGHAHMRMRTHTDAHENTCKALCASCACVCAYHCLPHVIGRVCTGACALCCTVMVAIACKHIKARRSRLRIRVDFAAETLAEHRVLGVYPVAASCSTKKPELAFDQTGSTWKPPRGDMWCKSTASVTMTPSQDGMRSSTRQGHGAELPSPFPVRLAWQ